jgi:hypothetical protein
MNLKQFLKPDWRKIVIFVILSFLSFSFWFLYNTGFTPPDARRDCCNIEIESNNNSCQKIIGNIIINPNDIYLTSLRKMYFNKTPDYVCSEYNLIIQNGQRLFIEISFLILLVSYLLSCLIIWIYDKVKVKKK